MRFPWQKAAESAPAKETTELPNSSPATTEDEASKQSQESTMEKQSGSKAELPVGEKAVEAEDVEAKDETAPGTTSTSGGLEGTGRVDKEPTTVGAQEKVEGGAPEVQYDGEKKADMGIYSTENTSTKNLEKTVTTTTTTSDGDEVEDESKYPTGVPLYLLTFGLCLGTFVVALDNTIIATAIPHITTVFNSLDDVGWYGSAYLLTTASLQPSLGKIYTFFNVKLTYVISVAMFEFGSVLCGAATSSKMLIVGRAVAGVGASGLFSGAMTIVAFAVPLRKRAIFIALVSSMFGISSIVGPILGGVFTDRVSWRWCFYINLPIGAMCIAIVWFFFTNPVRKESKLTLKQKIGEIDLLGAAFLISAVVCLLLALQWGGQKYKWSDSKVWGCFIGFVFIIGIFIFIQFKRGDRATLPPRILIYQRTVVAVAIFSFFLALGTYAIVFYLPIWFQAVRGVSAQESGIRTVPFLLSNIVAAIPVGAAVSKVGYYTPFIWVGSAIFPVGCGMLHLLNIHSGAAQWIGYQILAGLAVGACIQLPFIATQVVLSKKDMPSGNAIAVFFNTMGGAIGVSIAENIFTTTLAKQIPKHAPGVNAQAVIAAGATNFRDLVPKDQLTGVLTAYNIAVVDVFYIAVAAACIAFAASFIFEMKSVKGKNLTAGGAA